MACDELVDTADLPILGEEHAVTAATETCAAAAVDPAPGNVMADDSVSGDAATIDATDEFPVDGPDAGHRGHVHPYADGVIRFYRARMILLSDGSPRKFDRAWRFVHRLRPQELPATVRREFFDLVYLMQEHSGHAISIPHKFSEKVLTIAELIDSFVDEVNQESDDGESRPG